MSQRYQFMALLTTAIGFVPFTGVALEPKGEAKDAAAIIEKTMNLYRNLKSYHLERTTTITESKDEKISEVARIKFLTATTGAQTFGEQRAQLPVGMDFCNFTMEAGGKKFVFINDDHQGWWYSSHDNQFRKGNGILVMGSVGGSIFTGFHSFPFMNLDANIIREPRIAREATAEVAKQTRPCYVIEGTFKNQKIEDIVAKAANAATLGKTPELKPESSAFGMEMLLNMLQMHAPLGDGKSMTFYMPHDDTTKITLWIDKANHTLVRSEMAANFKKSVATKEKELEKEENVLVTITDAFDVIKVNEDVPKELFKFTPPVDAKEMKPGEEPQRSKCD